jgi:hypothetical protein
MPGQSMTTVLGFHGCAPGASRRCPHGGARCSRRRSTLVSYPGALHLRNTVASAPSLALAELGAIVRQVQCEVCELHPHILTTLFLWIALPISRQHIFF